MPLSAVGAPTNLKVVLLLVLAPLLLDAAAAAQVRLPHVKIDQVMLPNGLHAFLVESHLPPVVNVEIW